MNKERMLDADILRKLLGIKETSYDIDVPDDIIDGILESRRKRLWNDIGGDYSDT